MMENGQVEREETETEYIEYMGVSSNRDDPQLSIASGTNLNTIQLTYIDMEVS